MYKQILYDSIVEIYEIINCKIDIQDNCKIDQNSNIENREKRK